MSQTNCSLLYAFCFLTFLEPGPVSRWSSYYTKNIETLIWNSLALILSDTDEFSYHKLTSFADWKMMVVSHIKNINE